MCLLHTWLLSFMLKYNIYFSSHDTSKQPKWNMQVNIHSTVIRVKSNIALARELIPDQKQYNGENCRKCRHFSN